jgi:chromate transport protein ChrA
LRHWVFFCPDLFSLSCLRLTLRRSQKTPVLKRLLTALQARVGALVRSVFVIATRSIADAVSALIVITTILALIYIKNVQEPYIILVADIIDFCIKTYL